MTDELPNLESQEKEVPRWVQVPAGLVSRFADTAFGGYASLVLLLDANQKAPVVAAVVGFCTFARFFPGVLEKSASAC